jgi:hypothetical protein
MISVVIATLNHAEVLARALQPLVPAAVQGLVSEVIVADRGSSDATLEVADDAGCKIVSGGLEEGCAAAKGDWLLILDPTVWLEPAWIEAARSHIQARPGEPAVFPDAGAGLLARLSGGRRLALLTPRSRPSRRPRRLVARAFAKQV